MPWQHEVFGIVKNIFLLLRIADRIVSVWGRFAFSRFHNLGAILLAAGTARVLGV
jgi:hypothetical protein